MEGADGAGLIGGCDVRVWAMGATAINRRALRIILKRVHDVEEGSIANLPDRRCGNLGRMIVRMVSMSAQNS